MENKFVRNRELDEIMGSIADNELTVVGTNLYSDFTYSVFEFIRNQCIWHECKRVLICSRSIVDVLHFKDLIIEDAKEIGYEYQYIEKTSDGKRAYMDATSRVELIFAKDGDIVFKAKEKEYDIIFIDDIDHWLNLSFFSGLVFASKKLIVRTVDRPKSMLYRFDLNDFFFKYSLPPEDDNFFDFFTYKEEMGEFIGFDI